MTIQIFKGVQNQELVLKADYDKLAAECALLKTALNPQSVPDSVLDLFSDTATYDVDSCGPWSSQTINNTEQVILAALNAMPKPETQSTDAAIAEFKLSTISELVSKLNEELTQKGQSARRLSQLEFTWAYIETARAEMYNANLRAGVKNA